MQIFQEILIWEWERIVHLVTRKRRSDLQVLHEKEKGMRNNPRRNKYRLQQWIIWITAPTWQPREISSKAIHDTDEEHSYVQSEVPVWKAWRNMLGPKFERTKFRDKFPSRNVIQTSSRNARQFDAPPHDQRSTEWNEEQEEIVWDKAYKLYKELFKINNTFQRCS